LFGETSSGNITELKGNVAQTGLVKGTVKIVMSVKDLNKVKKGDILVTYMTSPNFLTAMKLAAAFVTNEGGLTCHAAIVAREMGKPCIIGTKIATKVFKDGDMVEMDANKGIVRKLK
jgi:pyruvate, water dikinase